jgi:hypothetical protein
MRLDLTPGADRTFCQILANTRGTVVRPGKEFKVTTTLDPERVLVRLKSIRDVFEEYEFHAAPKAPIWRVRPQINGRADRWRDARSKLRHLAAEYARHTSTVNEHDDLKACMAFVPRMKKI